MMQSSIRNYPKFVIVCDHRAVGVISCKEIQNQVYEVGCLCVLPEYQGLGIGTKAFRFILSRYQTWKRFTLVTPADKERNIKFYTLNLQCKCNRKK